MSASHPADADAGTLFLASARNKFQAQKSLAEAAIDQLPDDRLHVALDDNTNSIAVIMKHMAGNMLSRWTDFLTSDGEKPDRNRDSEFVDDLPARVNIIDRWEKGWSRLFETLDTLTPGDLTRTVKTRGHDQTALDAIVRQVDHYGYHVGQIVQLARHLAGEHWTTLSIPRGGSAAYNKRVWKKD